MYRLRSFFFFFFFIYLVVSFKPTKNLDHTVNLATITVQSHFVVRYLNYFTWDLKQYVLRLNQGQVNMFCQRTTGRLPVASTEHKTSIGPIMGRLISFNSIYILRS